GESEPEVIGDRAHQVHVETGVPRFGRGVLELERRVGNVRAHRERSLRHEAVVCGAGLRSSLIASALLRAAGTAGESKCGARYECDTEEDVTTTRHDRSKMTGQVRPQTGMQIILTRCEARMLV